MYCKAMGLGCGKPERLVFSIQFLQSLSRVGDSDTAAGRGPAVTIAIGRIQAGSVVTDFQQ
jgi:hypothetical protein